MKNVEENQLKKCIFKDLIEFKKDMLKAFGNDVEIGCDYDGIWIECNGEGLYTEEILAGISNYYDVQVTSIHVDECFYTGIWIVYK